MNKQVHILNGDSLKHQFPKSLHGEQIIARECLVDGDVQGDTLDEFFETRATFISENYGESKDEYYIKAKSEFLKIAEIEDSIEINLWFEDDLFCQVNWWFVLHLLQHFKKSNPIYLVRPKVDRRYGFAGHSEMELAERFHDRVRVERSNKISSLWSHYQSHDTMRLQKTAEELKNEFPFIHEAVIAHLERIPKNESMGRPKESLKSIIEELNTRDFGPVFQEFNRRETIYGFGDLQVKRLFDEVLKDLHP